MKPIDVKILLLKRGLNFADMARTLIKDGLTEAEQRSLEVMLQDLFYQRRWYPTLAEQVRAKFDIKLSRPAHLRPIRQQLKQAA